MENESVSSGRSDVEEMGVCSICKSDLKKSLEASTTIKSEVYIEDNNKESPSLNQEGRKLQQFQEEIVVLHDVPSSQLPEITPGYETFSSSSSCNDETPKTNEKSGVSLQLDERNGLSSPFLSSSYRPSSSVDVQNEVVQYESKIQLGAGRLLSDDKNAFLNDSDDCGNGFIQKGKQEACET